MQRKQSEENFQQAIVLVNIVETMIEANSSYTQSF